MTEQMMTDDERDAFLAEPHIAVLSVASDDGRPPHTVPLFYGYEPGGNITFYTQTHGRIARKTRLIEAAGAVTLNMQKPSYPYRYVTVEGTVVGTDRPPTGHRHGIRCWRSSGATCQPVAPRSSSTPSSATRSSASSCSPSARTAGLPSTSRSRGRPLR